jgi:N-acetylglutamate synthase-like GNAT family acetyltransferase
MTLPIRPARADEAPQLQEIERSAGDRFRQVGLDDVADAEPPSAEVLAAYAQDGRSWVAVDDENRPVGFVVVDLVDGNAHVEQISVQIDRQGVGVGRSLLAGVEGWAREKEISALTLTTFTAVPWNRPWYEQFGFVVMDDHQIGPELRAVRDTEARHGLDPAERVCMRLELDR